MRVSDVERAEITNALCRHYADGRLDEAEFNDRAARAAAAKTQADLAQLLSDLPPLVDALPAPRPTPRWSMSWVLIGVAVFFAVTWGTVAASSGLLFLHVPWLFIAILAFAFFRRRSWHHRYHHHH